MFKSEEQANQVVVILKEEGFHGAEYRDYTDYTVFTVGSHAELEFAELCMYTEGLVVNTVERTLKTAEDVKKYADEMQFLYGVWSRINEVMGK
ncbi:hypothetical protein [Bacillus thuringiensis]|uniref:hypothetical protein n=1 Tax=Bacillus thuringiensis TaxID=1428 RepID=UPI000BFE989F|nr:hypothetical protein [Bacillus thuringiensis]PGT89986.1 hypothetical protein COD17_09560 [Bacillus thuringiensis]